MMLKRLWRSFRMPAWILSSLRLLSRTGQGWSCRFLNVVQTEVGENTVRVSYQSNWKYIDFLASLFSPKAFGIFWLQKYIKINIWRRIVMSQTANLNNLFQTAAEDGVIGQGTVNMLQMVDVGQQIQAGLGANIDDINASEVTLVALLIDDSGSIRFANNSQIVRDGHNLIIESLKGAKQSGTVLIHTRYLNGNILYPFVTLDQALEMNTRNYNPNGGTPLYDQTVVMLGTLMAEMLRYMDNGVPVRAIAGIITDGRDEGSLKITDPKEVKKVIDDILMSEMSIIISAMGIDDGGHTDFRKVFSDMGIRDEWVLLPDKDQSSIRQAFQMFSRSAVRASQSAANFASMGGFTGP